MEISFSTDLDQSKISAKVRARLAKLHGWFHAVQAKIQTWKQALVRIKTPETEDPTQFEPSRKKLIEKVAEMEILAERSLYKFEALKIKIEDFQTQKALNQPSNRQRFVTVPLSKMPKPPEESFVPPKPR